MPTLMLIDGNSLTYRAFFALPADMATASGQVTNAVYGFASMLCNLVRDHQPDYVAVTFDRPEPTFRHEMVESYKANRDATPDILIQQMGLVHQLVEHLSLPILEQSGVEADDIIATLASSARDGAIDSIIVTGDRDSYQLVEDPHIRVLYNKRGVSDYALYDEAGIVERTGVHPTKYVEYAALRGDPSDNLPGVPGVGEKTAAKLINKYDGIEGIFAHIDDQTPKLSENLREHEAQARSNVAMMTLRRDVQLGATPDELAPGEVDRDALIEFCKLLEFTSLMPRFDEAFGLTGEPIEARPVVEAEVRTPEGIDEATTALSGIVGQGAPVAVAAAWVGEPGRSDLVGLAVCDDVATAEVLWIPAAMLDGSDDLLSALTSGGASLVIHDAKPLLRWLGTRGATHQPLSVDTKLGAYLLDPAEGNYDIGQLLARYCDAELASGSDAAPGQLDFGGEEAEDPSQQPGRDALATAMIAEPLIEAIDAQGVASLYDDIEIPLVGVLARMEAVGVGVDRAELERLAQRLRDRCEELRGEIHAAAGEEFNVNSTKQLRVVLYENLDLPVHKSTKTGPSTDHGTLEKLRGEHPIIELLLEYREVDKLRGTYGEGLLAEVADDDRIHATFNQTVARTGRLSSDAPNLHNIPVRTEEGRQFRRAFVPAAGTEFCVADYNQIELRCIAHLAQDPGLIEAFRSGEDIHERTAASIFGVAPADVTTGQRSTAKMVSYGLAYGMEAFGLAQRLNIANGEAKEILDAYFEAFPAVRDYMDRTVAEARERGYTETLFGRRRRIPELSSNVHSVRMAGERQAMNAGIQGLAADIFKVALVRLDAELAERTGDARVVLQVHDEVICESPPEERDEIGGLVSSVMTGAFDMAVPLEVNLAFGPTWADAKA